jgi:NADH dehydrogenase
MSPEPGRAGAGIVVIGGGFAGFWAAVAARRVCGPDVPVQLVSDRPHLVMRPRLYEASPASLSLDLAEPLDMIGVSFVLDRATAVDPARRRVTLESGSLDYDCLVLATGSTMRQPDVPGAAEAFSIDDQEHAIEFDDRLARIAGRPGIRIAVVGAGFTGIELALELPERLRAHRGEGPDPDLEVVLIDRAPVVGAELGPAPRPTIEAALDAAGVVRRLGASIVALGADTVTFSDGTIDSFDAVVLCTGLVATQLATPLSGIVDELGRHHVDPTLEHRDHPHLFLAGDVAAVDTGTGHLTLQSCQHALQLGRVAGENAARRRLGRPLIRYHQPRYVTCLDLGRSGAVLTSGWDRGVIADGELAKANKRRINQQVIYPDLRQGAEGLLAQSVPIAAIDAIDAESVSTLPVERT